MDLAVPIFRSLGQEAAGFAGVIHDQVGDELFQSRLVELGFVRGEPVQIARKTLFGDFIVQIKGAQVALRREEAHCLLVRAG